MANNLEEKFRSFAEKEKETLKKQGKSVDEFVEEALEWSKSIEGKLELDKFILTEEIKNIENRINELKTEIDEKNKAINNLNQKKEKKQQAISEIDDEIDKLD